MQHGGENGGSHVAWQCIWQGSAQGLKPAHASAPVARYLCDDVGRQGGAMKIISEQTCPMECGGELVGVLQLWMGHNDRMKETVRQAARHAHGEGRLLNGRSWVRVSGPFPSPNETSRTTVQRRTNSKAQLCRC